MYSLVQETMPKFGSTGYAKGKFARATIRYAVKLNVRRGGKTPYTSYLGNWLKGMFTFYKVEKVLAAVLLKIQFFGMSYRVDW